MAAVHQPPSAPVLYTFKDADAIVQSLAAFIAKTQKDSITKKGRFTIALSGGSLPKLLRGLIDNPSIKWDRWYVIYCLPLSCLDRM